MLRKMRWTIAKRLSFGFGFILLLMTASTINSYWTLSLQHQQYLLLANDLRAAQTQVARLESAVRGQAQMALSYALGQAAAREEHETFLVQAENALAHLKETASSPQAGPLVSNLESAAQQFNDQVSRLFSADRATAGAQVPLVQQKLDAYIQATEAITAYIDTQADALAAEADRRVRLSSILLMLLNVGGLALAIIDAVRMIRSVSRPLGQLAGVANRVAQGDLTVEELKIKGSDEVAILARSVNDMVRSLRGFLADVAAAGQHAAQMADDLKETTRAMAQASDQVAQVVNQIAQGTSSQSQVAGQSAQEVKELQQAIDQITEGAQQQAKTAEQAAADVRGMLAHLDDVAQKTNDMRSTAEQTLSTARAGKQVVGQSVAAMQEIQASVAQSASQVSTLGDLSGQIGAITETITAIAEQTNLLALNAAIEAARAGEQGRGFAVVAEEVRRLAERVASSAGEIAGLIDRIQAATGNAVRFMEQVTGQVNRGAALAVDGGRALEEIVAMVEETGDHVASIAAATEELVAASRSVQTAMAEMAAVTQESTAATEQMAGNARHVIRGIDSIAATAQETAASSEEVAASAEELNANVEEIAGAAAQLATVARELQERLGRFRM